MTTKTDDMTDRGNYSLSPWGVSERYSDCCYRVTFRGVDLGVSDSKAEAERVIADHIAAARQFAKEEKVRGEREAEERVEVARQQIPQKFRGLNLAEYPGARNFIGPADRTLLFGDMDVANFASCLRHSPRGSPRRPLDALHDRQRRSCQPGIRNSSLRLPTLKLAWS
jgi:hypothetical protein